MGRTPAPPRLVLRENGKWYVAYWDFEEGKRRYKSCEAEGYITADQRKEMLADYKQLTVVSAARAITRPTGTDYNANMREAVDRFLADVRAREDAGELKRKSVLRLYDVLHKFRDWLPEELSTGNLSARHLEAFIRIQAADYSPATVNVFRQNVRTCLRWLAKERPRLFPEPELFADALKLKRLQAKAAEAFTPAQLRAFAAALPDNLRRIFLLTALTGARRGEVLALTWADVDLARGRVTIRAQKTGRVRMLPLVSETPGIVDVAPGLLAAMRKWPKDQPPAGPNVGFNWWRLWAARLKSPITPQGLRRNFTSYAASLNVPASVCAMWQGHSLAVAETWYMQLVLERREGASMQAAMGL